MTFPRAWRWALVSLCAGIAIPAVSLRAQPREPPPAIHPEFPIRGRENLSPPIVSRPIHQCALAVHVTGAVPHAEVTVFANGNEQVGKGTLWVGAGDVGLMRALKVNDSITARQTVNGITSLPSLQPVTVTQVSGAELGKPEVGTDIWSCGIVVPVGKLTPSARVLVSQNGQPVGSGNATGDWLPVVTQPLVAGRTVTARQVMCADDPTRRIEGPMSDPPVPVKTSPNPPPAPAVIPGSVVPGKDTVDVMALFTGAEVIVRDRGNVVSSGLYATGSANWVPIAPPADPASKIDAAQKLCSPSTFSPTVDPVTELRTPVLVGPICDGQQFVVIRQTMLGANVVVLANGGPVGYGGGTGDLLVLGLGRKLRSNPQDHVTVRQYYGSLISPTSNAVDVVGGIGTPSVEIYGGEPFFLAEGGEESIDGPVFPRGRGPGPRFGIQTCCRENVRAEILVPNGVAVATLPLVEEFPGYYTATWDWTSSTHWRIPLGIGVGAYTVRVTTDCRQEPAMGRFYVIFDPAEVNGPPRFSFDETAIWFYSPTNEDVALTYALHPDDMRIFSRAIQAVPGVTSPIDAATRVAKAEANIFAYSVTKSDYDTLDLLQDSHAQCADDAGMLTAMLRAIGIPAHPATADAARETGFKWGFDTWTEFLVAGATAPEWKVVHTHWEDNAVIAGPSDRTTFGNNVFVAGKTANDIVLMAGTGWVWNEVNHTSVVTFGRQGCGEPHQGLNKKGWVDELCEAGYWAPNTHWACSGGTGTSSSSLTIAREPSVDLRRRTVSGEVTIKSGAEPLRDRHYLELVADVPETKVFGDRVLGRREVSLRLAPGASTTVRFAFEFREGLRPGETLHLRLVKGEEAVASVEVPFRSPLRIDTEREKTLRTGVPGELVVTVRNLAPYALGRVNVTLESPRQIQVGPVRRDPGTSLEPGRSATFRFTVKGIAPIDAVGLVIAATSDAGGARLRLPVRVLGPTAAEPPRPVAWPRRR